MLVVLLRVVPSQYHQNTLAGFDFVMYLKKDAAEMGKYFHGKLHPGSQTILVSLNQKPSSPFAQKNTPKTHICVP